MYRLTINGAVHEIAEDGSLLDYLRDTADITSVKNGCAEEICGELYVLSPNIGINLNYICNYFGIVALHIVKACADYIYTLALLS